MPYFSTPLRNRLGLAFFLLATWLSALSAFEQPTLLAWLSALHNLVLAFIYARRKPEFAYDRTGLWLGLIAAFLPLPLMPRTLPIPLMLIGLSGYSLVFWSLLALGPRFGIAPADRGLVADGPYRLVRHPMYLGELVLRGALLVGTSLIEGYAALAVLLMIQILRIAREEQVINGYPAYASQVRWLLIPFLF